MIMTLQAGETLMSLMGRRHIAPYTSQNTVGAQ